MDPILLIHRIKEGMEIPNLRDSLVKILQDYNLQVRRAYVHDEEMKSVLTVSFVWLTDDWRVVQLWTLFLTRLYSVEIKDKKDKEINIKPAINN